MSFCVDPKVKVILVNVFGGIVNCATIANGIVKAAETLGLKLPLVVRLEGNAENFKFFHHHNIFDINSNYYISLFKVRMLMRLKKYWLTLDYPF